MLRSASRHVTGLFAVAALFACLLALNILPASGQTMRGEPVSQEDLELLSEQATTQPSEESAEASADPFAQMSLGEHMKAMNVEIRALRTQLVDPEQNEDSLERVVRLQTHALYAKTMAPAKLEYIKEEGEAAELLIAYRVRMAEMIADLTQLEVAILKGDNAKAGEHYKAILEHRFLGHNEFRVDD